MEYLLKWKGYPDSENMWIPEYDLHCSLLLKKYKAKCKEAEKALEEETKGWFAVIE